jgi:hypothetical protein
MTSSVGTMISTTHRKGHQLCDLLIPQPGYLAACWVRVGSQNRTLHGSRRRKRKTTGGQNQELNVQRPPAASREKQDSVQICAQ